MIAETLTSHHPRNNADATYIAFQQNTRDEVRLMGGDGRYAGALAAEPGAKQKNYVAFSPRASAARSMSVEAIVPTLESANNSAPAVSNHTGVRRLTPTECERLQGFPDGWTAGQADTVRYRQLGNAVAVPVIEWLGKRIVSASK